MPQATSTKWKAELLFLCKNFSPFRAAVSACLYCEPRQKATSRDRVLAAISHVKAAALVSHNKYVEAMESKRDGEREIEATLQYQPLTRLRPF